MYPPTLMNLPRAKKSLGQNFLVDPNYQKKIINALSKGYAGQTILEIGPGQGAITAHLLEFAKRIVLVEKDHVLAKHLTEKYAEQPQVKVIQADFLKFDLAQVDWLSEEGGLKALAVGNLPYNVSSQILLKLLQAQDSFADLYLMFQKEVGQRCASKHGSKDYSMLSIWSQLFAEVEKLFDLPPGVFKPRPKVNSSFLKFHLKEEMSDDALNVIAFAKSLFQQRRKKISSVIKGKYSLENVEDSYKALCDLRPEQLSIEDLQNLYRRLIQTK
jgi:16S rRNA (adenine1518-N6/adenine1519-N6)-dimethyltransferase